MADVYYSHAHERPSRGRAKGDDAMRNILQFLAADYARSRIENTTLSLLPLALAVVAFARWVEVAA